MRIAMPLEKEEAGRREEKGDTRKEKESERKTETKQNGGGMERGERSDDESG